MFADAARRAATALRISVVIPALNEAGNVGPLVRHLCKYGDERLAEIIVVDGGSEDGTTAEAQAAGASVLVATASRAQQMNVGAREASGNVLYFVHADTRPPASYLDHIATHLAQDVPMGCFRFRFDRDHPLLRLNAFFTRFDRLWCRGGDQTLYVERSLFDALGGYDNQYVIMEEYDFLRRALLQADFAIMPDDVVVSARKYKNNSYLRVNVANLVVFSLFRLGVGSRKLRDVYSRLLNPIPSEALEER